MSLYRQNLQPEALEDDLSDDSDDVSDESEAEDDAAQEEYDTLKSGWQSLGLGRGYVEYWTEPDGFREFVQNWVDAIKSTSNLGSRSFEVTITDHRNVWLAKALHPDTKKLLGFIRHKGNEGTVELTNFDAQLSYKTLDLGFTSKRNNTNMAGTHGEGYKVACLVMARTGHQIKIEASGMLWKFYFGGNDKRHLGCCISATKKKETISKQRTTKANVRTDVSVHLGAVWGKTRKGKNITREEFLNWVKVSLDLFRPSHFIETSKGTLILDQAFRNHVYLKGLLLQTTSGEFDFKFGYNFAHGKINRDRQRLSSPNEERDLIATIWREAIEKEQGTILPQYVSMIRDEIRWGDVDGADKCISEETAQRLWKFHLDEDPQKRNFYYDVKQGAQDVEVIRKVLKKEPVSLKKTFWDVFRRFNLIRTPQEQRIHLFKDAPITVLNETTYSLDVKRALMAVLALDARTKDLRLTFKDGTRSDLDILIEQADILINDKWLDFHASHAVTPCSLYHEASTKLVGIDAFSCHHVITDLYDLILIELENSTSSETNSALRLRISEKLRNTPFKVEVSPGENNGEIRVSWIDTEADRDWKLYGLDRKGTVVMHQESTCSRKKNDLLTAGDENIPSSEPNSSCECPLQEVSMKDSVAVFGRLSTIETYFPMISRQESRAFYGMPPQAIKPRQISFARRQYASRVRAPKSPTSNSSSVGSFGHTDGEDDEVAMDSPVTSQSSPVTNYGNDKSGDAPGSSSSQDPAFSSSPVSGQASNELIQLRNEIESYQEQLILNEEEIQNAKSAITTLQAELGDAVIALEQAAQEVDQLNTQIVILQADLERATESIRLLNERVIPVNEEDNTQRDNLKAMVEELLDQQKKIKRELKQAREKLRLRERQLMNALALPNTLNNGDTPEASLKHERDEGQEDVDGEVIWVSSKRVKQEGV